MAAEADAEPALRVERARRPERTADDGGQRAANLRRSHSVRQRAAQRGLREQMKRATAIRERSSDRRKRAVWRDQPLLDGGVPPRTLFDPDAHLFYDRDPVGERRDEIHQHRVDDEAVVVIEMESWSVAVDAVSLVPLLVLPDRVLDARRVPAGAERREPGFDH